MTKETLREAEDKMGKAVSVAQEDLASIRTGRAHPAMFNKIHVNYYGAPTPINQLASFHTPEPRTMVVSPYDKSSLQAIERAIRDSDLGVNPTDDGEVIRVVLPELSEERRKEYVRLARSKTEEGRVAVRNVRRSARDSLEKMSKSGEESEDEVRRAQKELEDMTQRHVGKLDELLRNKESELTEV